MRKVIDIVIVRDNNKILLVRKKRTWILPGGKPKKGEGELQCLFREVGEELPFININIKNLRRLDATFTGKAPHKGDQVEVVVYLGEVAGKITPSAEINKAKWVKNPEKYNLSETTRKIIHFLRQKSYLS